MLHQRSANEGGRRRHGNGERRRLLLRRVSLIAICCFGGLWGSAARCPAQSSPLPADDQNAAGSGTAGRTPAGPLRLAPEQARRSIEWLARLAATHLPRSFEGDRGWGDTKRIWAGVKFERDGWKLTTRRRHRELRHGRWVRYRLTLPATDRPLEKLPLSEIHVAVNEATALGDGRWRVASTMIVPMQFDTRIERWNLGVQWYSFHLTGDLRVRLETTATIGFLADYAEIPPAVVVQPKVEQAKLVLERFEVDRISKLGGDFAEGLGDVAREVIEETWLKRQNERLAERINEKLDRRRKSMRWSLWEAADEWLKSSVADDDAAPSGPGP